MLSPGCLVSSGLRHGASPSRVSLYLHTWPGEMGWRGVATQAARPDPKPLGHPSQGHSLLGTQGISHLLVMGGFPGGTSGKEPAGQCRRHERCGFHSWVGKTPLEEGMVTHSSILVWRIPWTEDPDGLQSMALQRVGPNHSDLACRVCLKLSICSAS